MPKGHYYMIPYINYIYYSLLFYKKSVVLSNSELLNVQLYELLHGLNALAL